MKKQGLIALLLGGLVSSLVMASTCDNKTLSILGPDHFEYSLQLSKGNIGEKNNGITSIEKQPVTISSNIHQLFSAKGSNGQITGTIFFTNLDTKEHVSIPFSFKERSGGCVITPELMIAESNTFQAQATSAFSIGLSIKIKEFRN